MEVLRLLQELLSTPSILVGLMALVGLVLQKKSVEDVLKGTIKTIVGFLVLSAGSSFLQTGALNDFGTLFQFAFHVEGVVPNSDAMAAMVLSNYAGPTAMIMCFGMIANIMLARFSRWNYIFLTGHHTLYMACLITLVLGLSNLSGVALVAAGSLLLGFLMAFFPMLAGKTMAKITGTEDIGFAHFGTVGYWISAQVGKAVSYREKKAGRPPKSTEEINFPQRLAFLRDTTVAISMIMMVLFIVVTAVAAHQPGFEELETNYVSGGYVSWVTYALISGMNFAGGIYIILAGVRMILAEIVPAFRGIADRLVPNAKPAIDCPVVFPYAPNAVLIGFLSSFVGGIVGMFVLFGLNAGFAAAMIPVIVPGIVPHFFCGASAGVFGNAEGGLKGCMLGAFIHGLAITFLPVLCIPALTAMDIGNMIFGDADFNIVGILLGAITRVVSGYGLLAVAAVIYVAPIVYNFVTKSPAQVNAEHE